VYSDYRRHPLASRRVKAGAAITAAIGMTLAIRKLMHPSFKSKFKSTGELR
jgi:hypothetical protein